MERPSPASLAIGVSAVALCAAAWLVLTTPQAVPFGDVAVIEMMTKAVGQSPVMLGPYSQYGWHHPGPLLFYVLAPVYGLAGFKSVGLSLAAAVVNLTAMTAAGWTLSRHMPRMTVLAVSAPVAVFVWRAGDLVVSPWNAHVIVLTLVSGLAACAMASLRDGRSLIVAAALLSLATQSSVSVVPCAAAGAVAALALCVVGKTDGESPDTWLKFLRLTAGLAGILWLPPIVEQFAGSPGNATKVVQFFRHVSGEGPGFVVALDIWADALTAPFRGDLALPWGERYVARSSPLVTLGGLLLVVGGVAVAVRQRRTGQQALARLSVFAMLGACVGLWSTTRIVGEVGGYHVFWLGGVGALLLGCILAEGVSLLCVAASRERICTTLLGVVVTVAIGDATTLALGRARQYAFNQVRSQVPRREVAIRTVGYLQSAGVERVQFGFRTSSWLQGAGIALHAYREGLDVRVERSWLSTFGRVFEADGSEELSLEVGGGCPPTADVVSSGDGLCVYVRSDGRAAVH